MKLIRCEIQNFGKIRKEHMNSRMDATHSVSVTAGVNQHWQHSSRLCCMV